MHVKKQANMMCRKMIRGWWGVGEGVGVELVLEG